MLETGSYCVALNTQIHTWLCFPNADIKGICHSTQPELFLYFIRKPLKHQSAQSWAAILPSWNCLTSSTCVFPGPWFPTIASHCCPQLHPTLFFKPRLRRAWSRSSGHIVNAMSITRSWRFFFLLQALLFWSYQLITLCSHRWAVRITVHFSITVYFRLPRCLTEHLNTHSPKHLT